MKQQLFPLHETRRPFFTSVAALLLFLGVLSQPASAQFFGRGNPPMKKANELIRRGQPGPKIDNSLESVINPNNSRVVVSLSKQRAYLMVGDQVYIDTPISSGKRGHETPTGSFRVMEKDADHRSSIYGDFVIAAAGSFAQGLAPRSTPLPAARTTLGRR